MLICIAVAVIVCVSFFYCYVQEGRLGLSSLIIVFVCDLYVKNAWCGLKTLVNLCADALCAKKYLRKTNFFGSVSVQFPLSSPAMYL